MAYVIINQNDSRIVKMRKKLRYDASKLHKMKRNAHKIAFVSFSIFFLYFSRSHVFALQCRV